MILRVFLMLCLSVGLAQADTKPVANVETGTEVAAEAECDTCLARHKGKQALRAYLAEKRAKEAAEQEQAEVKTNE